MRDAETAMTQLHQRSSLIGRFGYSQDLQRDLAVELGVGGLPDLAHAALTQEGGDVGVPEAGASGQGHRM